MKHKKLLSVLAASTLFVCGINAISAATTGNDTITIKSTNGIPLDKEQFLVYRMLDAEKISDTEEKYTIIPEWQDFFNQQVNKSNGKDCTGAEAQAYLLNLQKNPKAFKSFKEAAAEYATQHHIQDMGTDTKTQDSYKISGLPNGYYIIIQEDNADTVAVSKDMLVTVDSANPNATINLKADVPSLLKTITGSDNTDKKAVSYNVGDKVPFRLVSKVPDISGYLGDSTSTERYVFEVCDTMSKGLTLDPNSVKVKIGDENYTNFDVVKTDDPSTPETEWRIVFGTTSKSLPDNTNPDQILSDEDGVAKDPMFGPTYTGKPITITYDATLNENAILGSKGNPNTANVEYSSNPYKKSETKHTWDSTAKAYTFGLDITKANSQDTKLQGAEFTLKKADGTQLYVKPSGNNGHYVFCESKDTDATATVVSDANGKIYIDGLNQGDYQLVETKAPAGYKLLPAPIKFNISATFSVNNKSIEATLDSLTTDNKDFTANKDTGYLSTKIVNVTGGLLPKTGGRGAILFIIIGLVVIGGATVITLKSRKKSA